MIECHIAPSPLGHLVYRAEDDHLTGLFFVGQKHFPVGLVDTSTPKSRVIAHRLTEKAFAALKIFRGRAEALEALATFLLQRNK